MADRAEANDGDPPRRRLSDTIAQAFFKARERGYDRTAEHLQAALESLAKTEAELYPDDRRSRVNLQIDNTSADKSVSVSTVVVSHEIGSGPHVIAHGR